MKFRKDLLTTWLPTILVACLFCTAALATPLVSTVKPAYQLDYKVKACGCGFKQYFGALSAPYTGFESTENLATSITNVIDVINTQLEINLRLRWDGFLDDAIEPGADGLLCTDIPPVCSNNSHYSSPGYILVKARPICDSVYTACTPSSEWEGNCPAGAACGIDKCLVAFCDKKTNGSDHVLVMKDSLPGATFQSTLLHEMLHDVGYLALGAGGGNQVDAEPFSSLNSAQNSRFPWDEDCTMAGLPTTEDIGFTNYVRQQTYRIRHVVSPDGGVSWYYGTDNGLLQHSNDPVALAINTSVSPARLLLAFTDSEEPRHIKTILGTTTSSTTVSWDNSTLVVHPFPAESWFGPSLAYGAGQWLMAWSDRGSNNDYSGIDGRAIYYAYSFDGEYWTDPIQLDWTCDECSPLEYGSLGAPVVKYDAGQERFIVMWVNWFSATEIPLPQDDVGSLRQCALIPGLFTEVSNCSDVKSSDGTVSLYTWNTPALSCHPVYNLCLFTMIPEDGDSSNMFITHFGHLDDDDTFDTTNIIPLQSGWTSRNELSGAYGNNTHYVAYRGQNANTYINVGSYTPSPPGWTDKDTLGISIPAAPTVVVGPGDDIRVFYIGP